MIDSARMVQMAGLGLGGLGVLGSVGLIVAALAQITRALHLREAARAGWVLVVVCAPVFGAVAWFAVGNRIDADQS
ncbi:MAG: PLDc N-terminal domain-containing protein [Cryobacterium sp.]|nr:PLDc N-terminal domain-containing protein [Cryobacterium sp.]